MTIGVFDKRYCVGLAWKMSTARCTSLCSIFVVGFLLFGTGQAAEQAGHAQHLFEVAASDHQTESAAAIAECNDGITCSTYDHAVAVTGSGRFWHGLVVVAPDQADPNVLFINIEPPPPKDFA